MLTGELTPVWRSLLHTTIHKTFNVLLEFQPDVRYVTSFIGQRESTLTKDDTIIKSKGWNDFFAGRSSDHCRQRGLQRTTRYLEGYAVESGEVLCVACMTQNDGYCPTINTHYHDKLCCPRGLTLPWWGCYGLCLT